MAWLRIDDGFTEHQKLLMLSRNERWTWLEVLSYCARRSDGGNVPGGITGVLKYVTKPFLTKCHKVGLLDKTESGYKVHDWAIYNAETIGEKVAAYLAKNPTATANEVHRAIGGKREVVLSEHAALTGTEPVPDQYPSGSEIGTPTVPDQSTPPVPLVRAREPDPSPTPDPEEQLGVKDVNAVVPRPGPLERLLEVLHDKDKYTKSVLLALHREFQLSEGDFEWARECATGPGVKSPTRVAVAELKKRVLDKASA